MHKIMEDKRRIEKLVMPGEAQETVTVGQEKKLPGCQSVSKIVPYGEPGEMTYVPWFAVYDAEGRICQRINGKHVETVIYANGKDESLP